ncbi:CapA family protein [Patescibacteria group bacterium]|nr:CapA family protein [Patescibacteria group bacterium]
MSVKFGYKTKTSIFVILAVAIGVLAANSFFETFPINEKSPPYLQTAQVISLDKPNYSYNIKDPNRKLKVSATAYYIGDLETGQKILSKDEDKQLPIASVSKLMTALVSLSVYGPENIVSISKDALKTEGQNGNFRLNEKFKLSDILYPLLLESSNDAAEAIAISNNRADFIERMNDVAKQIGLTSTSFEDPSGLSPNNVSTAEDLFKLAKYVKEKNPEIFKITTNKSYKNSSHTWFSNNQFLKDAGYTGGKSGFTNEAIQTGISTYSLTLGTDTLPRPIAITLLHTTDRHKDVESILKYLKSNVSYGIPSPTAPEIAKETPLPIPIPVPEVKDPEFVTMQFGGDIMLDRGVRSSVERNFAGDYSKLFDHLDILQKADVVFANLEGPASDKGIDKHNLYSFRMDPGVVPALASAGVNILSVANNHVGDWGRDAYTDTLARLRENEIQYTGGGMNSEEAEQPATMEIYGMRLGFLGFTDKGPEWMKATSTEAGPLMANNPRFDEIIKNAAAQVDYLIVSFHFGEEYQTLHNARQSELAHRAIDDGAKIIIGAHPHVIEDTEVYKKGYIAYSLGNFIFDQARLGTATTQGMLLQIKLHKDGSMETTKNIVKTNSVFQPDQVILGKEEKVNFDVKPN